jgi:hypothetical protein
MGSFGIFKIDTCKTKHPNGKLKSRWETTVSKEREQKNGIDEE